MMRSLLLCMTATLMISTNLASAQDQQEGQQQQRQSHDEQRSSMSPPIHLWFEPEWFDGVKGSFAYWPGPGASKPTGSWGVAGPGISAEWSQGGESEWNSMGAPAEEKSAKCQRDFVVPRDGTYRVWVRYVDHRGKAEPFRVRIEQAGKAVLDGELGVRPVVPSGDEYQLWWGFSKPSMY